MIGSQPSAISAVASTLRPLSDAHQMKHKPGEYVVATDRAIVVTRDVLVRHGYRVVRVQDDDLGDWYRAGNHGRGKGGVRSRRW